MSKKSIIVLRDMVWVYSTVAVVNENDLLTYPAAVSDDVLLLKNGTLALSIFSSTPYRLDQTRLQNLTKLCRLMQAPPRVRQALNQPDVCDFTNVKNVEELMLSTFPGEDSLKEELDRRLWN